MGFRRHKNDKKRWATQSVLDYPWPEAFSVDQEYSLAGCSSAEPDSACPDGLNIIPTFDFEPKSYPHVLGFR